MLSLWAIGYLLYVAIIAKATKIIGQLSFWILANINQILTFY